MAIRHITDRPAGSVALTADVCIIGAGMAGLVAARRLCSLRDKKVIVVESGERDFDPAIHELNAVENPFGVYQHAADGRFRGLGGSSSQWGGKLLPLNPSDSAERLYVNAPGWPLNLDDFKMYGAEIEALFQIDGESYEEDAVELWDKKRTIPRHDDDFVLRYPKWPTFGNCNLARLLREPLESAENLEVWLGATVCAFDFNVETRRLRSVSARDIGGRNLQVSATEFLIAGGAIETTRLLLLLDMQAQGKAFPSCQVLGRYFQDHLGAKIGELVPCDREWTNGMFGYHFLGSTRRSQHLELSPAAQKASAAASGFAHVTMAPGEDSPMIVVKKILRGLQRGELKISRPELRRLLANPLDLFYGAYWRFVRKQLYWPASMNLQMNVWIEQLPHWENRVVLSDKCDAMGVPMARLEWRAREMEERTFQACVTRLQSYWNRHQIDRYCGLSFADEVREQSVPIASLADDRLHPSGSTRMGIDAVHSVVDTNLRAHEVNNLSVASASVFPTAGSANPTYTILQMALHAAEKVKGKMAS